jgi:hypothetical protein
MPRNVPSSKARPSRETAGPTVAEFMASLEHPQKPALLALREIIRGADPAVGEAIKWNAPSFHTHEHFATFHLRRESGVQVVLHLGAKPRPDARARERVADPQGLLEWRGPDRATATFADLSDVEAKREAFAAVLHQWLALVE